MKFPLQYAKILSQKYLNIDDDIIPEIERCLEREGDKVILPYDIENFGITINENNVYRKAYSYSYGFGYGDGESDGSGFGSGSKYITISQYNDYYFENGNGKGNGL